MCGIAGMIVAGSRERWSPVLRAMARAIAHRGPDDEGFLDTTTRDGAAFVGLGHRRLSIIDVAGGHQPIANEDATVHVVFNGEIYNFRALRADLEARGHRFTTSSDTETIVHAYEEFGDACVDRLRGMFAFAIWDARRERLLLARDRFGKKPLYLHDGAGGLVFGSEISALLAVPDLERRLDERALWNYFAYRYVPGPATLFSGIRKLQPGHYAVWQQGALREYRYYVPPDRRPRREPIERLDDSIAAFREKLDEAVRIRMVSDVPFGAFLSGGIDSSAVVALMSRHSNLPVKTFSVGFDDSESDELVHAREVSRAFGTDHYELEIREEHVMSNLSTLVQHRGAPAVEPSDIPLYLLAREAQRTVKMVLTGEGADEVIGGYPKHVFERYARLSELVPELVRRRIVDATIRALPYQFHRVKTALASLGEPGFADRMPRWFGALSSHEQKKFLRLEAPEVDVPTSGLDSSADNSPLRRILYFDQTSWLPDNLLERADRVTMAASIEARMPFIDHQLVGFVSSLPDRDRVRGRTTKWILRQAMRSILPRTTLERRKVGFRVPVHDWFRGAMRDYVHDHLTGPDSRIRKYVRPQALDQRIAEHMRGRQNHEKLIWCLLTLEVWHRTFSIS